MSDASVKLRCLKTGELYDANTASFYSEHGGLFEVAIDFKMFLHLKSLTSD